MRSSRAEDIVSNLENISENLAGVLSVTPDFADRWAYRTVTYPLRIGDLKKPGDRRTVSFGIEDGLVVQEDGEVTGVSLSDMRQIDYYDNDLVMAGMANYASWDARAVMHVRGIEAGPTPEESLMMSFISSIGAVRRICADTSRLENIASKEQKMLAKKTVRLARTVVAAVVEYPDAVVLPHEAPTQQQALALGQLRGLIKGIAHRDLVKMTDSVTKRADDLPRIDIRKWQDVHLRLSLNLKTPEEIKALEEWADSLYQNLED